MMEAVFTLANAYAEVAFSINTSFEDFEEANLLNDIDHMIKDFGVNTENIIIEILETGQYKDEDYAIDTINKLKQFGFKIAIDDFGTGNSNFGHLMLMKVDFIKIDGQFVKNIATDEQSQKITKTINEFAHMTGAESVAEFVCDESVYKKVCSLGVDYVQGYYICEPKPALQIDEMLRITRQ
jgi:EAL domain-containing protein (putative c-di-GMP-specific phosphodiesterase class I)